MSRIPEMDRVWREMKPSESVVDKTLISFALVTTDHKNEGGEEKTKRNRVGKISATPGKTKHKEENEKRREGEAGMLQFSLD